MNLIEKDHMINSSKDKTLYEAGFVQRREWMLYKIKEDHSPFNIGLDFKSNSFNHDHFQKMIDAMVKKHEVLRTTLTEVGGELKQVVHNPEHFTVSYTYFNIIGYTDEEKELFLTKKRVLQASLPFNFEFGPLFRINVFALNKDFFEIHIVFHHIIFDNQSVEIFKADVGKLWGASQNLNIFFEEKAQYRDYTSFENSLLGSSLGDSHREHWKEQLRHKVPRLLIIDEDKWKLFLNRQAKKIAEVKRKINDLPFCDERFIGTVCRRYKGENAGRLKYRFSNRTFRQLVEFRKNRNNSAWSFFIAGLLLALKDLSGQNLFALDIPAARKMDGDNKKIIGWLSAGGLCYFNIEESKEITDFLNYIDKQLFQLSKHCIYPFETMGYDDEIPLGSTIPVFFALIEIDDTYNSVNSKNIETHELEGTGSYENLNIFINVFNNACTATFTYNNLLFSPNQIEKIVKEHEQKIDSIINNVL